MVHTASHVSATQFIKYRKIQLLTESGAFSESHTEGRRQTGIMTGHLITHDADVIATELILLRPGRQNVDLDRSEDLHY